MTFSTQRSENHFTINLRLHGLPAILALIFIPAGLLWLSHHWYAVAVADMDGARQRIQLELDSEYTRENLPTNHDRLTTAQLREIGERFTQPGFTIEDLQLRGTLTGRIVARVQCNVNGHAPSDGETVRFYRMRHSSLTGWHFMPYRVNPFEWTLAPWR